MPHVTDQNLLFGVLALQAGILDNDQFAAACAAWATRKHTGLADLLAERGWITPNERQEVERMVGRHLKRRGGDAGASLAAVTGDAARHSLAALDDAEVRRSLAALPTPNELAPVATTDYIPGRRERYTLTRLHATGGIGRVWVARDADLNRDVALKELRPERAGNPAAAFRFLREAQVTGQLEHPGVVPVYELARRTEDGQPFYAMRFVHGRTLTDALRAYHRKRQQGEHNPVEWLALLNAFAAVCDAVAYAHSRGVVHRDLKGQNVALGDFGEVVVLDWGFAKLAGDRGIEPEAQPVIVNAAGEVDVTVQGQVVGTPAYMAPEQAEGRLDRIDRRTDVYGLGAMMYEVLTGRAPFTGASTEEVLQRIRVEEPERPRKVAGGVPAALEAICLKALAKRPADRYATAGELGQEVRRWLADEPVRAWREPLFMRAGRWVRRHKPAVAAMTAAVLVALLLGGAGLLWTQRQAEERRRGVETALDQATEMQGQARWAEARAVLEQAEDRLGEGGPPDLRGRLKRARKDLDLVARLDAIQLQGTTLVEGRFDFATADREYEKEFRKAGLGEVGEDTAAVAARVRASGARQALVDALDDWAIIPQQGARLDWVLGVARQADPDPWRDRVRDPKVWTDRAQLARLAKQAPARLARQAWAGGAPLRFVGFLALRFHRLGGDAEELLRATQGRLPGDFWVNFLLGEVLYAKKRFDEAVGFYRAALAVRPDAVAVLNNLGLALGAQGKVREEMAAYLRAIQLDPKLAKAHNNLGLALAAQGKLAEAVAAYRRAIQLDRKLVPAHYNLGNALKARGQLAEAVAACRRAVKLDPKNAKAHTNLGAALGAQGKLREEMAAYLRAIALGPQLALPHYNLGIALKRQGRLAEAVAAFRRAIALDPKYVKAHYNLGVALHEKGQLGEAVAAYRRAIELEPTLTQAHGNLGQALLALGRFADARQSTRVCLRLLRTGDPSRPFVVRVLRKCQRLMEVDRKLPAVLSGEERSAGPDEQVQLGELCRLKQRYASAARFFADAFASEPKLAGDLSAGHRYDAACCAALAGCGRGEDAAKLEEKEKARLRDQAVTWLRADLKVWDQRLTTGKAPDRQAIQKTLRHWQTDGDLAGVRDKAALAKLPQEERRAWRKLWEEVEAVVAKVGQKK
jgi:serine/threonine-protein kinase